jgi:hypothetical protein
MCLRAACCDLLQIEEQESEGLLEGGTATEVATYLIISAAQVRHQHNSSSSSSSGGSMFATWAALQQCA